MRATFCTPQLLRHPNCNSGLCFSVPVHHDGSQLVLHLPAQHCRHQERRVSGIFLESEQLEIVMERLLHNRNLHIFSFKLYPNPAHEATFYRNSAQKFSHTLQLFSISFRFCDTRRLFLVEIGISADSCLVAICSFLCR